MSIDKNKKLNRWIELTGQLTVLISDAGIGEDDAKEVYRSLNRLSRALKSCGHVQKKATPKNNRCPLTPDLFEE